LTGRQNVILNGIVQGFSKGEMNAKIPQIQEFADIGEFFDQPVKIYSSGMFVRLAFAAAINVDPDILIVDEALAVGDAKFQHKCYNKFLEFQKDDKTIIFVTHDTNAIVRHCDYAVLLEGGRAIESGEPKTVTNYYLDLLFTGKIHGYSSTPVLVEEGYRGFNIVHTGTKYYAFSQSLGLIDLTRPFENELHKYIVDHKCAVGSSLEEVRQLVDKTVSPEIDISNQAVEVPPKKEKTELERFLEEIPEGDNCVNRRSYNKNEYRHGSKEAEIIDYLMIAGGTCDAVSINSVDMVDIYVKYKFHKDVESPLFGFAIKTVDGILIYGYNTNLGRVKLQPIHKNSIKIVKFSVKVDLNAGDYFINLGCSEYSAGEMIPFDRRYGIIHLVRQVKESFTGVARLETVFSEISKRTVGRAV
ncbi:MAG TPA: Wzt carbohydrate-binding domain-containing protein, partial [Chryseolinea sp.]|nr:Wzt carbohydrate-binding domain-containing protein [Chryseolinea sp.]